MYMYVRMLRERERERTRIPQGGGANRRKDATCARSHPFRQRDEPSSAKDDVFAAANDKYLSRQHPRRHRRGVFILGRGVLPSV